MKRISVIVAACLVAMFTGGIASASSWLPASPSGTPTCVTVVLGFPTVTGHEADEPVTLCGNQQTGLKVNLQCNGATSPQPGARFTCVAVR